MRYVPFFLGVLGGGMLLAVGWRWFGGGAFFSLQPSIWIEEQRIDVWRQWQARWQWLQDGGVIALERAALRNQVGALQERATQAESDVRMLRQALKWSQDHETAVYQLRGGGSTWWVEAGCKQGIFPGMTAVRDGVWLGQVREVSAQPALARLQTLRDTDVRLLVRVGSASAHGVFVTERGEPEVWEVPITTKFEVGQVVVTAGNQLTPDNLVVGFVSSFVPKAGEGRWRIHIRPALLPQSTLGWVSFMGQARASSQGEGRNPCLQP